MRLFLISLSAAAVVAAAAPARAQAQPGPLDTAHATVTPFIGASFAGDLDGGTLGVGADASYNWDSRISLEGEFMALPSTTQNSLVSFDASTWNVTANLLYHFNETNKRSLIPYAAAGLGVGHGSTDFNLANTGLGDISTSSTSLVVDLGGGVKKHLTNTTMLRGDVRYFTGNDLVPDFLRIAVGVGFDLGRHNIQ